MHLLVVEDDPRLGRLLLRLFSNDRHVVDLATAGQDALELLEANAGFDAVILDYPAFRAANTPPTEALRS